MPHRLGLTALSLVATVVAAAPAAAQSDLLLQLQNAKSDRLKVDSAGGFVALGNLGVGAIPATGTGVRMMWYPRKAAFRVGRVEGTRWDDVNVGDYSFAQGFNSQATGTEAAAFGEGNASGTLSFAAAAGSASGDNSFALGYLAYARGNSSFAAGSGAEADSVNAVAIGYSSQAGRSAVALGYNTTALGAYSTALGSYASTNGQEGSFFYGDKFTSLIGTNSTSNQFAVRAQHVWLGRSQSASNTAGHFIDTSTGAYLTTGGTWTNGSSRLWKEGFAAVNADDVLRRIVALSITRWNYKVEPATTQHIGPVAQDFYAAFRLGDSDQHIAPSDLAGVSLLGIQALERRTQELREENVALKAGHAALQARIERLEAALQRLESR